MYKWILLTWKDKFQTDESLFKQVQGFKKIYEDVSKTTYLEHEIDQWRK